MTSTLSTSYHWRATLEPTSGLFWWSADTYSILMPRFSMPESSTAMRAASTEPAPARSVYRLDMSDSTPILTTLSEICACATPAAIAPATARATILRLNDFMLLLLRGCGRRLVASPDDSTALELLPCPSLPRTAAHLHLADRVQLHAEIIVELLHVRRELRIREHVDDPPVFHHVVTVRDRRREAEILFDQQDREAFALQPLDRAPDLLHDHRCQALGRFVEQQQAS